MTIALATRGYICTQRAESRQIGPGPSIVSAKEVSPSITGAQELKQQGPVITSGGKSAPVISSAAGEEESPAASAPAIVGAGELTPTIKGS